jgi:hypothetical protein
VTSSYAIVIYRPRKGREWVNNGLRHGKVKPQCQRIKNGGLSKVVWGKSGNR